MKLQQHELTLAKRQRCKRIEHRCATLGILEHVTRGPIVHGILPQAVPAPAPSLTQLIQGRIASNREQPGARGPTSTIEAQTRTVEPLERERGEILSRRAIAQKRDQIPMHIGSALSEEGIKRGRVEDTLARCRSSPRRWLLGRGHGSAHHPNYDGNGNPSQTNTPAAYHLRCASAFRAARSPERWSRPRAQARQSLLRDASHAMAEGSRTRTYSRSVAASTTPRTAEKVSTAITDNTFHGASELRRWMSEPTQALYKSVHCLNASEPLDG